MSAPATTPSAGLSRLERLPDGGERTIERKVYGEALLPDAAKAANLLRTLVESYDTAGVETITLGTFQGDIAASQRRLLQDPGRSGSRL